ncbi:unnamed protein product [Paramecium sonneborni]|uniref:MORN repeat protein n=1 Tax=Paramecium sonneborni TaxID=65129 RepID=A0A8S1Q4K5_9CILI|nr:unnamed protein product [Paramecium sonneborni]
MKEECKNQRFVCEECIYQDHQGHRQMISNFFDLAQFISNKFGDTNLDIKSVFDQSCQQEFKFLKQQIFDELQNLEDQFNQVQEQIKNLLDAHQIITKIKVGHILELSLEELNTLCEILQNPKIINQQTLNTNLSFLKNSSSFLTTKLKETQKLINSSYATIENIDFISFLYCNVKSEIRAQYYATNFLNYNLIPLEYQNIKGTGIREIQNRDEIYYGQVNEKQLKHGKGMQIIKNGEIIYEGIWNQDYLLWGQKTIFNDNQESYIHQGEQIYKKPNVQNLTKSSCEHQKANFTEIQGPGIQNQNVKDFYLGEFQDNKKHGKGVLKTSRGEEYKGQFQNDKKQGIGTYYFANGDIYKGNFKDDQLHGKGELIYQNNGESYTGFFQNNKKEGEFEIKFSNGQKEKIYFKNDQQVGNVKSMIKKAIKGSIFQDKKA